MTRGKPAWTKESLVAPHQATDKARRVRGMFNSIAPRYELINSLFSFGRDRGWRKRAVRLAEIGSDDEVLDVAAGTGDLARAFACAGPRLVVGTDFAHQMLRLAPQQADGRHCWCESDAAALPFHDASFDVVCCAFGVRNFQDLDLGLHEMRRVLRAGGRAIILEFTTPPHRLVRWFHDAYANRFMPLAASLLSGDRSGAYRYLPRSVVSFVGCSELVERLRAVGFARVETTAMTMGIVTIYAAWLE